MSIVKVNLDRDIIQIEIGKDEYLVGKKLVILTMYRKNKQMGLEEILSPKEQELKEKISNEVKEFQTSSTKEEKQEVMKKRKSEIIEEKKDFLNDTYRKLFRKFFSLDRVDFRNLKPKLVLCKEQDQKDIWTFFRMTQSSHPWTGHVGRQMRYLLIDENSGCVMGILGLSSDLPSLNVRDRFVGWSTRNKFDNKLNCMMNISDCVVIEPFNQLLIGKLLSMLAFSDVVMNDFEWKYGEKLVGISTCSLYGESIQYDRLSNFLKYLGLSEGIGSTQFSRQLIEKMRKYFDGELKRKNRLWWEDIENLETFPKCRMIASVVRSLGLNSKKVLTHSHRRGIYVGFTYKNGKEFLYGKIGEDELVPFPNRSSDEITTEWRQRWFVKRIYKIGEIEKNRKKYIDKFNVILFDKSQRTLNDLNSTPH